MGWTRSLTNLRTVSRTMRSSSLSKRSTLYRSVAGGICTWCDVFVLDIFLSLISIFNVRQVPLLQCCFVFDIARGPGDGFEALLRDGSPAINAFTIGTLLDTFERLLHLRQQCPLVHLD